MTTPHFVHAFLVTESKFKTSNRFHINLSSFSRIFWFYCRHKGEGRKDIFDKLYSAWKKLRGVVVVRHSGVESSPDMEQFIFAKLFAHCHAARCRHHRVRKYYFTVPRLAHTVNIMREERTQWRNGEHLSQDFVSFDSLLRLKTRLSMLSVIIVMSNNMSWVCRPNTNGRVEKLRKI